MPGSEQQLKERDGAGIDASLRTYGEISVREKGGESSLTHCLA